jgi:FkbM family methyltransferase
MENSINDSFISEIKKIKHLSFIYDIKPDIYFDLVNIGFVFTLQENKSVLAAYDGICFTINAFDELFILHEIFFRGVYNYSFNKNHIVIDIGMNVGFSSLYFAKKTNVNQVISYEPIDLTYRMGLCNFSLNPFLRDKIMANNFGVGNSNREEKYKYEKEWKGSAGVRNNYFDLSWKKDRIIEEMVSIKDVIEVIESAKQFSLPIVLKMDCEGSEFEIIEHMKNYTKLRDIVLFMLEFHDTPPDSLLESFNSYGFITITNNPHFIDSTGLIYAIKK